MKSVNVSDAAFGALSDLATRKGLSVDDLVAQALARYLSSDGPPASLDDSEGGWDRLVARIQSGLPDDVTAEEIDRDVAAELEAARDERIARRR